MAERLVSPGVFTRKKISRFFKTALPKSVPLSLDQLKKGQRSVRLLFAELRILNVPSVLQRPILHPLCC
jgi:hypothetical protein